MALVGITAHLGLFQFGQLKEGELVYVPGGTGGVGSMVVQMAKAAGARVATAAGSPERLDFCRRLGADLALNYHSDDIPAKLREFSPEGVDVWYETQREPNLEVSIPLLRKNGRMILIAGRTAKPALPLGAFYPRNCAIFGFAMFNASADQQRRCAGDIDPLDRGGRLEADRRPRLPVVGRRRRRAVPGRKDPEGRGHTDRQSRDHHRIKALLINHEFANNVLRLDDGGVSAPRLGPRQDRRLLLASSPGDRRAPDRGGIRASSRSPATRSPTSTS